MTKMWILLLAAAERRNERGDVPGWVLITVMTAGLVAGAVGHRRRPARVDAA